MRVAGGPSDAVSIAARHAPRGTPATDPESSHPRGDVATLSEGSRARVNVPVDLDKIERLKQELATEALSPNPTNIAAMMLAESSSDDH